MAIGVCYFPEHWPRDRWAADIDRMAEAGFTYVRMGEFAWSRIEPEPGDIRLDWLEEAVDLVADRGMQAVLCTPTATPPKWLLDKHPDVRQVERDGTVRAFGGRRHYCFNSPTYRRETERIVAALADRFADHAGVVGWQIDNEFGCHGTVRCYCDDCGEAFRSWLAARYEDVDALNDAWGTTFWSQHHTSFTEIDPPGHVTAEHHPSRLLDFHRFASASVAAYSRLQADLLRARNEDWFVTHNFMASFEPLDAHHVTEDLTFPSWDSYPTGFAQYRESPEPRHLRAGDPDQVGLNHDLYRRPTGSPALWVTEQQPGGINWSPHSPQPAEGAMRLWAHHATAHGAEAVLYFRWRRCLSGQEQYHAGLLARDGSPDRGLGEASDVASELAELDPGPVEAPVAILHDYENLWALSAQPHGADFDYWGHLGAYYRAVRARGITVDVVHPDRDLSGYVAVVAPTLYLVEPALAERLTDYVAAGGHLLLTMRSGVKDRANTLHPTAPPGPLADLAGVTVDQHESLPRALQPALDYEGDRYAARTWTEWLAASGATVVAEHRTGAAADRPAVTILDRGAGRVMYVGVWPRADLADALVTDLLDGADLPHTDRLPDGVRLARRGALTWVTNFTPAPLAVRGGTEWLVGDGHLEAYDAAVVRSAPHELTVERPSGAAV